MKNTETLELPTTTLLAISEHLRMSGSKMSAEQTVTHAMQEWIAAHSGALLANRNRGKGDALRGYQWKNVFLPDGTDLRMTYAEGTYYARVEGDQLLFQGRPVSPRSFALHVAGGVRNAWRDLWIRFSGRRDWKRAQAVRAEQAPAAPPAASPVDTINAAAACMSDALKTALMLVEHTNAQSARKVERRLERHRRETDILADYCKMD